MRIFINDGADRTDHNPRMGPFRCDEWHRYVPELGYNQAIDDAEERMKRKERQMYCPVCLRWIWLEYVIQIPRPQIARHVIGRHYMLENDPRPPLKIEDVTEAILDGLPKDLMTRYGRKRKKKI